MSRTRPVLLVQLPIPPAGPTPILGNVPLAAGYLIMMARRAGLDADFQLDFLPPATANYGSDQGLVEAILERDPWMVGFTCYLWNIDRTLWIAAALKARRPELLITMGGPEITADNDWVLASRLVDYAVIGEGEQTFVELLAALRDGADELRPVDGLWRRAAPATPAFRRPLPQLDTISSPYLEGILDAADERMLLLETIRGCVFKCKFCYYPKSYDNLYFLSEERIVANLRHARERGAAEVVLLDPTLNQRRDFDAFLRLLARENHDRQFRYFGELRAEGITPTTAQLLAEANFTEVEIGLQSIDPSAQTLMDRRNNLRAFERGVAAMLDAGLSVKVDLIIGLPGDTPDSIRRSFEYLAKSRLYSSVQVFNLAILPGTAFRQEAASLGLRFQPRPPYYVLETPTLKTADLYALMAEAQEVFQAEWDPFPEPKLSFPAPDQRPWELLRWDLDVDGADALDRHRVDARFPAGERVQAPTTWFRGKQLDAHRDAMRGVLAGLLDDCPHSTLQVVLEPTDGPEGLDRSLPQSLLEACFSRPNYLDRYYSLNPTGVLGSKRVLVLLDSAWRARVDEDWLDAIGESATIVWRGGAIDESELAPYELCFHEVALADDGG